MSQSLTTRRQARIVALQALFQLINAPDYLTPDLAIRYALEVGKDPDEGYEDVEDLYLYQLVEGVVANLEEIDTIISKHLTNWSIERLQRIDLSILRLAIYEMLYLDDETVPKTVAVDEATILARSFSDDKSRKFVSGILLKILNESEE
ncbi:transcription antitermination factor NusB [Hutsoniella sourekii]